MSETTPAKHPLTVEDLFHIVAFSPASLFLSSSSIAFLLSVVDVWIVYVNVEHIFSASFLCDQLGSILFYFIISRL
jgi:hypothetical protein